MKDEYDVENVRAALYAVLDALDALADDFRDGGGKIEYYIPAWRNAVSVIGNL